MDVAATTVARGTVAADQPDALQDVEVVSEQVRRQPNDGLQLHRCPIGPRQLIDDREPDRIAESGESLGAHHDMFIHALIMMPQSTLSQEMLNECRVNAGG